MLRFRETYDRMHVACPDGYRDKTFNILAVVF